MFLTPKDGKHSWWRLLVVLLPISVVGALAIHTIPGVGWDDAALLSTVFSAVTLLFVQHFREFGRNPKDRAPAVMSLITQMRQMDLTAEERADITQLDRKLASHFWRWAALYVVIAAAGGVLIHVIAPGVGWRQSFTLSAAGCIYLLFAVLSPWYGYRRWTRSSALKTFAVFATLTMVAALIGVAVPNARPLSALDPEKALRAVAIALLLAILFTSLMVGISRMRLREADQRAARLAAEAEGERLARQNVQAELKLLQAQVEPHFLFNTLANVRHLMQAEPHQALAMLDHLIQYLRTALPEMRGEGSTLGRETQLARAYLEIMRLRMGGMLEIAIDIPDELAGAPFPPLMLITLVENAIKHGIAPTARGKVAIRAREEDGKIRVTVEDDGPGLGGTLGSGMGLANVRERLAAIFGEGARLDIESHASAGTRASIEVPAHAA
jgi:hypothetical protein